LSSRTGRGRCDRKSEREPDEDTGDVEPADVAMTNSCGDSCTHIVVHGPESAPDTAVDLVEPRHADEPVPPVAS
jgi:hypothetical protein